MSLLRRKNGPDNGESVDPTIEFARRALQNPNGRRAAADRGKDETRTVTPPADGVDSAFCYGEESNSCA